MEKSFIELKIKTYPSIVNTNMDSNTSKETQKVMDCKTSVAHFNPTSANNTKDNSDIAMNSQEPTSKDLILTAIGVLKNRKARTDTKRISNWINKKYGRSLAEVEEELERLVSVGELARVEYKGSPSFRIVQPETKTKRRRRRTKSPGNPMIQAQNTFSPMAPPPLPDISSPSKFATFVTSLDETRKNDLIAAQKEKIFKKKSYKELSENEPDWKSAVSSLQKENEELKNDVKRLKDSFEDLKNFVMTQMDGETVSNEKYVETKQRIKQETDTDIDNHFEQPLKKVKLEDQSEEIEKLNQIVKNLKEDIVKLQMENCDLKSYGSQSEN